jgi:hypothetical protein
LFGVVVEVLDGSLACAGWSQARRDKTSGSIIEDGVFIVFASDDHDSCTDIIQWSSTGGSFIECE